jgi:hypothetical protein
LDKPALRKLLDKVVEKDSAFEDFKVEFEIPELGKKTVMVSSRRLVPGEYVQNTILVTLDEVTKKDQTAQGQ